MSGRRLAKARARLHRPAPRTTITRKEQERAELLDWFVLLTKPQREDHACNALLERDMVAFTPIEWRWRKAHKTARDRSPVKHNVPAYPKYVFLGVPKHWGGLPWHLVNDITFIRGFLAHEDCRPVRLNGSDIAKVMRASQTPLFDAGPDREPEEPVVVIEPGDFVRITDGPLTGLEFIASRRDGSDWWVMGEAQDVSRPIRVTAKILAKAA